MVGPFLPYCELLFKVPGALNVKTEFDKRSEMRIPYRGALLKWNLHKGLGLCGVALMFLLCFSCAGRQHRADTWHNPPPHGQFSERMIVFPVHRIPPENQAEAKELLTKHGLVEITKADACRFMGNAEFVGNGNRPYLVRGVRLGPWDWRGFRASRLNDYLLISFNWYGAETHSIINEALIVELDFTPIGVYTQVSKPKVSYQGRRIAEKAIDQHLERLRPLLMATWEREQDIDFLKHALESTGYDLHRLDREIRERDLPHIDIDENAPAATERFKGFLEKRERDLRGQYFGYGSEVNIMNRALTEWLQSSPNGP